MEQISGIRAATATEAKLRSLPEGSVTKTHESLPRVFYGSKDDIGGEKDLNLLTSSVRRLPRGPSSVDTAMIADGNHEYVGEEAQVAQVIAHWIDTKVAGN